MTVTNKSSATQAHLVFLDDLRASGVTNMFGAGSYLRDAFPELSRSEANEILSTWMKTFSQRHPKGNK